MTELTGKVQRKVTTARGEPLVVALTPEGIWLREPRQRTAFLLPYGYGYQLAAKLEADRIRREKAAAKQANRDSRRFAR